MRIAIPMPMPSRPHAGAGVEIFNAIAMDTRRLSPPTRGRELKSYVVVLVPPEDWSPPTRGRELKLRPRTVESYTDVAPHAGAGVEIR